MRNKKKIIIISTVTKQINKVCARKSELINKKLREEEEIYILPINF